MFPQFCNHQPVPKSFLVPTTRQRWRKHIGQSQLFPARLPAPPGHGAHGWFWRMAHFTITRALWNLAQEQRILADSEGGGGVWDPTFVISSQMMPMQLFQGPHFEWQECHVATAKINNHCMLNSPSLGLGDLSPYDSTDQESWHLPTACPKGENYSHSHVHKGWLFLA